MPNISNFTYCLDSSSNNISTTINGVLNVITPDYIPGNFSFSVFLSILDIQPGTHELKMIFKDPDDNIAVNIAGNVVFENPQNALVPLDYLGINVSANWNNVLFEKSGEYKTEVYVDEELIESFKIYAIGKNELR